MTQIEDTQNRTAEVGSAAGGVELSIEGQPDFVDESGTVTMSLVLTPRQARALARQLLAQADAEEYGEEG